MKLPTIIALGLLSAACYTDFTYPLHNGYRYEQWGNNFISVTADGETRQAIEGQVERYSVNKDHLIATQKNLESGLITYWVINMATHEKTRYLSNSIFLKSAISLGFDQATVQEIIR